MDVVTDGPRLEAPPEEVPDAEVAGVEGRGVGAVQSLHPVRERRLAALDDEVEVVSHQAIGMEPPAERAHHLAEVGEEESPVVVVHEHEPPVDAARCDVVDAVRKEQPS
jgi:hypothetical protein